MEVKIGIPLIDMEIAEKCDVYLVGGTVRDFILRRKFSDYDIVVRDVDCVLKTLKKKASSLVIFPLSVEDREYRCILDENTWIDVSEMKGKDIVEDLSIRDFTLNSIAIQVSTQRTIDPFGGLDDIKRKIIRTKSLRNLVIDPLRILRAYRFTALLGFSIESKTRCFLKELSPLLSVRIVAAERIWYELTLILSSPNASSTLTLMSEDSVLFSIFPELEPMKYTAQRYYNEQNLLYHSLCAVAKFEEMLKERDYAPEMVHVLKLAVLLHDIGKPMTMSYDEEGNTHFYGHDKLGSEMVENIADRLKMSRRQRNLLKNLVRHHMYPHLLAAQKVLTDKAVNRYLRRMDDLAFPLLDIAIADALASPPRQDGILPDEEFRAKIGRVIEEKQKLGPGRLITGDDLILLGLKPSPLFRVILGEIDDLVAEGTIKNRDDALLYIKQKYILDSDDF